MVVLVVEDELIVCFCVVEMLFDVGFDVIEVVVGDEVFKVMEVCFDIVVLFIDVEMFGMVDGYVLV